MSEIWAYCDPCGRWFYPGSGEVTRSPACPVCSTETMTLADQPGQVPPSAAQPA